MLILKHWTVIHLQMQWFNLQFIQLQFVNTWIITFFILKIVTFFAYFRIFQDSPHFLYQSKN